MTCASVHLSLIKRSVNLFPGSVHSCVKHARKHRLDFATDPCRKFGRSPADTRLTGIFVFFGVTSCSCGEPDGRRSVFVDATRRQILWCTLAGFTLTTLSREIPLSVMYTESIVDYISVIFVAGGSQEALEMETPLSTGGPECHSRMTRRPLPATRSIAVLVVAVVVIVVNNASSTSVPRRPIRDLCPNSHANLAGRIA